ncbi:rho guanine nucleotide exchange factor TIAM2 isoform 2-T2 [Pholidichthys leucotaenia]
MGNTDSHNSFVSSSSCSLRFSSRIREEVPSARSWWRSRGRSHPNQNGTWHYKHTAKTTRGGGGEWNQFGYGGSSGGSPKVLLSKDGSMRVEFTKAGVVPVEQQESQEASFCTSNGGSLSSDGSWYDSPWGGGELSDNVFTSVDNSSGYTTSSSTRTKEMAPGSSYNTSPGLSSSFFFPTAETNGFPTAVACYNTGSSSQTEDSGIGDSMILHPDLSDFGLLSPPSVYNSHYTLPAFPTDTDMAPSRQPKNPAFGSTSALPNSVVQEGEGSAIGVAQQYSSMLPCRKAEPVNNRKDFLKSRIQRLSDWTGSLSRKKRRLQEPSSSNPGDGFWSTSPWSSNPLHHQNPTVHFNSYRIQNQSDNVHRQNIYENFMQELEMGCSSTAGSDEEEEEKEGYDDNDEEEGAEEQMEELCEKEQGVVRRAGWLSFKPLITVNKDRKLELVCRRRWRHYWVVLKGCSLLFYETYGRISVVGGDRDGSPRYALPAEDGIVQAVPEHPKKEHVFCLSNSYGDVYLFQATSQTDVENWVTAVHSASAALLAQRRGTEETLKLLQRRSRTLVANIDTDRKMKKMAELQLSIIKEPKNRKAVERQIQQWDQNLERLNLDLFRLRCYLSSLQGGELPNPKSLLAVASRSSKSILGRLGVFSVSSFHALVCSRDAETLQRRRRFCGSGAAGRRRLPSSLRSLEGWRRHGGGGENQDVDHTHQQKPHCVSMLKEASPPAGGGPSLQSSHVFSLNISRPGDLTDYGFAVTGHVDGKGRSHVFVSEVDPMGLSLKYGLRAGDQILAVNGASVSRLDLDLLQSIFIPPNLQLLLRREQGPDPHQDSQTWTTVFTDPADVPLPVSDDILTRTPEDNDQSELQNVDRVYSLYQTFPEDQAAEVDAPKNPYSREAGLQPASPAHLSVCQRLHKVIQELVDTEKSYVKDLVCLFDLYLTPLQTETFLSKDEMEALFGSLPELLGFQRVFLQTLEERIAACPNFSSLETPEQFKKLLFSLGGSFLYYADHFKLYGGFCANHIKVQKVLERAKTDAAFKRFLETRNPTNQHSSSLESYLIKPVQRVLKYPLLLRELVTLTDSQSQEHAHLSEALRAMEKVASHINEMQKIYEEFGCVFDQLAAEQTRAGRQVTEISMGEFLVHSSVVWLNPLPSLGRLRKDPELCLFVFKQAVILIYRENGKLKKRTNGSRSADLDPFRFRWLIPASEVQVRPANVTGPEELCVWELVHSRSEVEGRPETVFQLCSSGLEAKAGMLQALRSLLRDQPSAGSLRRSDGIVPRRRRRCRRANSPRTIPHHSQEEEENHGKDGVLGDTCSEPLLPSHAKANSVTARRTRLCSLTSDLEAQLQRLNFSQEEEWEEERRQSSSVRQGPGRETADYSNVLERDFSIQSLNSIINEDCFYDPADPCHRTAVTQLTRYNSAPLQGHSKPVAITLRYRDTTNMLQ